MLPLLTITTCSIKLRFKAKQFFFYQCSLFSIAFKTHRNLPKVIFLEWSGKVSRDSISTRSSQKYTQEITMQIEKLPDNLEIQIRKLWTTIPLSFQCYPASSFPSFPCATLLYQIQIRAVKNFDGQAAKTAPVTLSTVLAENSNLEVDVN